MDGGAPSEALAQGGFQVGRPVMLAQKVAERFLSQVLKAHHAVTGKQIDGLPRFILELDPLSAHQRATCWPCSKRSSIVAMSFENSAIGRLSCVYCPQSNVRNTA
jgi:hypothetical protein